MTAPAPDRFVRRAIASLFALAVAALGAASCNSVLALDGYQDAADAICARLDGCYASGGPKDCAAHVGAIREATQEAADAWLHAIGRGCLDSCSSARVCLDVKPVCAAAVPADCTVKEDCCNFSTGGADCVDQRCCVTAGHHCDSDGDCCKGVCDHGTHTCGGTQCRDPGLPCDIGAQCCSGACRDKACSEKICDEDGFDCKTGDNCCSGYCNAGKCGQPKQCGLLRSACTADADCCGPDGSSEGGFCYLPPGAPVGLCSVASTCAPIEADCSNDAQCCSAYCDPTYHKCGEACHAPGAGCAVDAECCSGKCTGGACDAGCSNAYCAADTDCCTGHCILGTCAPACGTKACDHTTCQVGSPLDPACPDIGACVKAVCAVDAYCCCNAWDSFCVLETVKQADCTTTCQ